MKCEICNKNKNKKNMKKIKILGQEKVVCLECSKGFFIIGDCDE